MILKSIRTQLLIGAAAACVLPCATLRAQTQPAFKSPVQFGTDGFDVPPSILTPATPPRVVEMLVQALTANPAAARRVELLRDLGETRLRSALPAVLQAMSDPDPAVRCQAAGAAAKIGEASAIPTLRKLLADADASVRVEAIRAGTTLNDPTFVTDGLTDADESCFTAACRLASTAEQDALIAARVALLSPASKRIAVQTLGHRRASAHMAIVASQLSSADSALVVDSIGALAEMMAVSELGGVQKFLTHEHPTLRRAAVRAVATLGGKEDQLAVAKQMLGDADLTVRQAAVELVTANPTADAVPVLVQQLSAGYQPLRTAARQALAASATVASSDVTDSAVKLLDDPDPARRSDGSFILGQIKSQAAFEKHLTLLSDPDWTVVAQAAESLGIIGRQEAADALMKVASRAAQPAEQSSRQAGEVEAIGAAFIACGKVQHKPALAVARQLIGQKLTCPVIIRTRAIWACGVLGNPADAELAGAFISIANDNTPFEVEEARFEAIKAIGNQGYKPALDTLQQYAKQQPVASLRWMAHSVADRLAGGAASSYTPPTVAVIADTSIQDLSQ